MGGERQVKKFARRRNVGYRSSTSSKSTEFQNESILIDVADVGHSASCRATHQLQQQFLILIIIGQ
jgi:hypothetical protein